MMKILYHHRTQAKDGQRVHIDALVQALRARGCEVVVVEPPSASSTRFGESSPLVKRVRRLLPRALYELLEFLYSVVAYRRLRVAWRRHRPDVLYERHNLFLLAGAWLHRRTGIPYMLEVNSPLYEEREAHGGLTLARLAHWTERFVWREADVVLPVTEVLAGIVTGEGVPRDRIVVVPNGIDRAEFAYAPDHEDAKRAMGFDGRVVLGFTGFVRSWHGLDRVIDFLARGEPAGTTLLVAGDGPARAELEAQAGRLGVADRVRFTGVVAREDVARHVAAFDVALQPAATPYASPLKLFEYMALGCAIVAPNQPNIREVLTDGHDALLFDPWIEADFAAKVERLAMDPVLRGRLAAAAKHTLSTRDYTWSANAGRVMALAQQLAGQRLEVPVQSRPAQV